MRDPKPKSIWWFDVNRRVYEKPLPGRIWGSGGPIWREHWVECAIKGETSRSWITERNHKIPKTGPTPRGFAWTLGEIADLEWVEVNRHFLSEAVRMCDEPTKLKQIAALIGYVPRDRRADRS